MGIERRWGEDGLAYNDNCSRPVRAAKNNEQSPESGLNDEKLFSLLLTVG
jgi:hypothetical protein